MANQVDNLTLNDDTSGFNRTVDVSTDDLFLSVDLTLQSGAVLTADNIKRGTSDPNVALLAGNEGDLYQRTLASTGELWVNTDGTTTGWELSGSGGASNVSIIWTFDTTTTAADPGSGNFRMNNATPGSVTALYVDSLNANGLDMDNFLGLVQIGDDIYIQQGNDATRALIFTVSSITDNTGWWTFGGTVAASVGALFDNAENCVFVFQPGGATGANWATILANGNTSGGTNPEISDGDSIVGEDAVGANAGDVPITGGNVTSGNGDGGDVVLSPGSGSGTGVDGVVIVNGPKHYANSATDPTSPTPAEGDRYYNTTLEMDMRYDGTRSKWLSVETCILTGSDQGALASGAYFQVGTLRMSSTRGYTAMYDGTVVALGYTRTDTDAASFAVTAAGSTISSVASTATSGQSTGLDGDFTQGAVLGLRNDGANSLSNGIVWARVKWRA
jgi:hypothetical protein